MFRCQVCSQTMLPFQQLELLGKIFWCAGEIISITCVSRREKSRYVRHRKFSICKFCGKSSMMIIIDLIIIFCAQRLEPNCDCTQNINQFLNALKKPKFELFWPYLFPVSVDFLRHARFIRGIRFLFVISAAYLR